jgi:pyruvate formate lyase activating enzyme
VAAVGSVPAKPGNPWPARAADRDACLACDARACVSACPEAALRVVGAAMTADQVVARAARDLPFYRASGGGLTLSGGEPLLHPAFVAAVIAGCRDRGIPVIVETCGDVPPEALDVALDGADQVYLDLKVADPDAHARWTGRPNDRVLASLARAASRRAQALVVRVPLVPGVNDSPEALAALARLVAVHRPAALHLVPYHGLGVQKYVQTARRCAFPESAAPPSAADLARAAATFRAVGLPVTIDG